MIQGSELPFLSSWQNFYMLMGTSAATLTGLMFVVTTLIAGIDAHLSTLNAAVSAYNTPTVVHLALSFCLLGYSALPGKRSQALAFYSACWVWGWWSIRSSSCSGCGVYQTINRRWKIGHGIWHFLFSPISC